MASQVGLSATGADAPVAIRIASPEFKALQELLWSRYPYKEWGTFITLSWTESELGMIMTVHGMEPPEPGDLDLASSICEIQANYIRRVLRKSRAHNLAVGFVHSHPLDNETYPSDLDDDMEKYFSKLFKGYRPQPFVSLIFSLSKSGLLAAGGRVYKDNVALEVSKFFIESVRPKACDFSSISTLSQRQREKTARLVSAFSEASAVALAGSTVGVVGLSGTGSPVVELLARAGVGKLVLIDYDFLSDSNIERIHGSEDADLATGISKAALAKRHVKLINPDCEVVAIRGRLPQKRVVDQLLWCDIVVGCTDQHSPRIALTELALRYNLPIIDVGVVLEGKDGIVSGQVIQLNKLFPGEPCVYCRDMIDAQLAGQEVMSDEEVSERKAEAEKAASESRPANAYWKTTPQLNTVGYLTTLAGSLVTGYTIGYLTGRFEMGANRIELNIGQRGIQSVSKSAKADTDCPCQSLRGLSVQDQSLVLISAPSHWPDPVSE